MSISLKKHCLFVGLLTSLYTLSVFSQTTANNGVALTGTVLSVEPVYSTCLEKKSDCLFQLNLLMQFRNNTTSPAIIFDPNDFYGQKKISFLSVVSKTAKELTSTTIQWKNPYPPSLHYDPLSGFVRALLFPYSSPYKSVIIPPDGYHEYRASYTISTGYKLQKEPDPKRNGHYILSAIPEHPALRIEYFLSVRNRPEDANAFDKAKENWKKFGDLLLDSSGDYRIESEIILNKLL